MKSAAGSALMLAGLLVWLLGTPKYFLTARLLNVCADPTYHELKLLLACALGGPLLVALGLTLTRYPKVALIWVALAGVMLAVLCTLGTVTQAQLTEMAGLSESFIRCDG
jgi:hypothetical protein